MSYRQACRFIVIGGVSLMTAAVAARADLIAATSFEAAQGYTSGIDVRTPTVLTEPGDWGGNRFFGKNGGNTNTGAVAEGPGTAYAGDQFLMIQRSGTSTDTDVYLDRKFTPRTGILYYGWAFRIDTNATGAPYWSVTPSINMTIDRKMTGDNTSDANVGIEVVRIQVSPSGTLTVKRSGGDLALTGVDSPFNNWVKVEALLDISAQRWWLSWNGALSGPHNFKSDLSSRDGKQVNMLRFQCPRLDYTARGERLRIDDLELRTDPPQAMAPCLMLVSPTDVVAAAPAGQPATPSAVDFTVQNFGQNQVTWTAVELDQNQTPADVPWLSLSSPGGSLDSMASTTVTASINTAGVTGGDHYAYVQFTDNCNPPDVITRQIKLTVSGCTWTLDSCDQVRAVLQKYPSTPVAPVSYLIANTGQTTMNYTVTPTGSVGWLTLTNATGSIAVAGTATVTGTIDTNAFTAAITPGNSATCVLSFADDCSGQVLTRQVRVRYVAEADTYFCLYGGHVAPTDNDAAGTGLRLDLYNESGLTAYGKVERDLQADDGLTFRIQDPADAKTKYRFTTNAGDRLPVFNEAGMTIVGRIRVYSWTGSREGGLYIWETSDASAVCHWGGWNDPIIAETLRGWSAVVTPPPVRQTDYVTLRMTAVGRPNDTGATNWDCSRSVRVYLNEDPTPVLPSDLSTIPGAQTVLNMGLGFGAGSTSGTYDIAFDWVTASNAGAFAPGEEVAVIGRSLIPVSCPVNWADLDHDGDVDQVDFGLWQICFTGANDPNQKFDGAACRCVDRDRDADIDITDAAAFAICATGPDVPFDVNNPPAGCQ